jgi:anti-sigma B factor antagonist
MPEQLDLDQGTQLLIGWDEEHKAASGRDQFIPINVQVRWAGHDVTVILAGELDCASAPVLSARLAELLAKRPQRLVLDLAQVEFMDCAGVSPIAKARQALPADRPVILRSPTRRVRQFLRMTHLEQLFTIQDG